jgi:hypothetical protein
MRGALISEWLNAAGSNLWEQVDQRTYGTPDEEEDVLWYAHAQVERRSLSRDLSQVASLRHYASVRRFPSDGCRRLVG